MPGIMAIGKLLGSNINNILYLNLCSLDCSILILWLCNRLLYGPVLDCENILIYLINHGHI
jgi:hypothetical protein